MTLAAGRVEDGLIRQVQKALGERSLAAQLAEALYAHNGLEGMPATPAWLASQARSALEFISEKPRKKHKLRIRPLEGEPGRPEGTAVEILNDDMPFLVDSIVAELQARGLAVLSFLHPIFKTERDRSGRLQALLGPGDQNWNDGRQESYISIRLARLSDAGERDLAKSLNDVSGHRSRRRR